MHGYIIPSIASLPRGYDCTLVIAPSLVAGRLTGGSGRVVRVVQAYFEGRVVRESEARFRFEAGELAEGADEPVVWRASKAPEGGEPGYLEIAYRTPDGSAGFRTNRPIAPYAIYAAPGRKSFFSDNAQKFGNPVTIDQIAKFGQYCDGYPVVDIDRTRDYGESLILINPYKKPVLASIHGHDGREIRRRRVPAMAARRIDLAELLRPGEERWSGRIQLTATNRLIPFDVKHSFADPTAISDHEHLDPFRGDPTHFPLTQTLRLRAGEWASRLRAAAARMRAGG